MTTSQIRQRRAQLRKTTKLLGSDIIALRKKYRAVKRNKSFQMEKFLIQCQKQFAEQNLKVGLTTLREIVTKQSWVTIQ